MAKVCPVCGCREFKKAKVDPNKTVIVRPRICAECGHRYVVPLPRWVGLLAYLAAAAVVGWMLVDWFAPPEGWDLQFTWKGRVGMVAFACYLGWMGSQVLKGET